MARLFSLLTASAALLFAALFIAPLHGEKPPEAPLTAASHKLSDASPVRQFGASDFRLTAGGPYDRQFRLSPDGSMMAGANGDEVRLWSFPNGKLSHDFSPRVKSNCIGFSADGRELLAYDYLEKSIFRFDIQTGELRAKTLIGVFKERSATYETITSDGRWFCTTGVHGNVGVWDATTGVLQFYKKAFEARQVLVQDGETLLVSNGSFLDRYDVATGDQLSRVVIGRDYRGLVCNPTGQVGAAYSLHDKKISFLNLKTGERIGGQIPADERQWNPELAAISADGTKFAYWTNQGAMEFERKAGVFEVATGKLLSSFAPPDVYFLQQPIFSLKGETLLYVGERSAFTPVDVATGKPLHQTGAHVLAVQSLAFTPNGKRLIVGSGDKRQAWHVNTGEPGTIFDQWYHTSAVALLDNHRAIVGNLRDGNLQLRDIESGAVLRRYEPKVTIYDKGIGASADGRCFTGFSGVITRWDVETGKVLATGRLPVTERARRTSEFDHVYGLAAGGKLVVQLERARKASKGADGTIDWGQVDLKVSDWEKQSGTLRWPLPAEQCFAFTNSPDGLTLAVATSDDWHSRKSAGLPPGKTYCTVWDVTTGWRRLQISRDRTEYYSAFFHVAVNNEASLLATASERRRIELWNGFSGELIQTLDAGNDVSVLAFSANGQMLASGHLDGSVRLWDVGAARERAIPRQRLSRDAAERCWNELANGDSTTSRAVQSLRGDPDGTLAMLSRRLLPAAVPVDEAELSELIAALDAPQHSERNSAASRLSELGLWAAPALTAALQGTPSAEQTARIRAILDAPAPPLASEVCRNLIAVKLLEDLGTAEASSLLERLAAGAAAAPETQTAQAALRRMALRKGQ